MSTESTIGNEPELTHGEVASYLIIALGKSAIPQSPQEMIMALPPAVKRSFGYYALNQPASRVAGREPRSVFIERMLMGADPLIKTVGHRLHLTTAGELQCEQIWEQHEKDSSQHPYLPEMLSQN